MNVTYCKKSTLREVYAAVVGLPEIFKKDEFDALKIRIQREWPTHELSARPALLTLGAADEATPRPPDWFAQVCWDDRRWFGRWGHRFLGLHRMVVDGERYQTFQETMRPTLGKWLRIAQNAYDYVDVNPPAASVVFGYVNNFVFTSEEADLSDWFRFNFAIDVAGASRGLSEFSVSARIPRPDQHARAAVHLRAQQGAGDLQVTVHTTVESDLPEGMTFKQTDALLDEINRVKILAKETFFSFVTDRTLIRMEATDAQRQA